MGCFVVLFALISPRLALFFILIFSDWIGQAIDGWIVPMLGFFFLPWTLLAYVIMWQVTIHITFLLSAIAVAATDRILAPTLKVKHAAH